MTYIVHMLYYQLFPAYREVFNMRFVLDCYHIASFEVHGQLVSDQSIQASIEKIFSHKFRHYLYMNKATGLVIEQTYVPFFALVKGVEFLEILFCIFPNTRNRNFQTFTEF